MYSRLPCTYTTIKGEKKKKFYVIFFLLGYTKEYTSHPQIMVLGTKGFKKAKKSQKFSKQFQVHRMEKVSAEIIPHNSDADGSCWTHVRILASATEQLKSDIMGMRERCKIMLSTQVVGNENGRILVPHQRHEPVNIREDGDVNFMYKLINSNDLAKWGSKKFEVSIEVILQVESIIRASEVEYGYLHVTTYNL